MEEKFKFSHENQKKIVAMMFFDGEFLKSYEGQIKPKYFDNPVLKDLSKMAIDFYEKYSRIPNTDEFWEELDNLITEQKKKQKDLPIEEYTNVAAEVVTIGADANFDYVRDKALAFAKHQAMERALLSAGEVHAKDSGPEAYQKIVKLVNEAAMAGDEDAGLRSLTDVEAKDVHWLWENHIPLGEITLLIGDPGVGKSYFSYFLSAQVSKGGYWPNYPNRRIKDGD